MSDTQLSGAALNRALAATQGTYIEGRAAVWAVLVHKVCLDEYTDFALAERRLLPHIPDWAGDPNAAFLLCLDIAKKHGWHLAFDMHSVPHQAQFWTPQGIDIFDLEFEQPFTSEAERAEALDRLALAALTAKGE